ncbi:MAG: hypothetical protein ABR601_06650 [Parasphingopyxis sp.]|nr:hypothetical protein [Sphingomonadales bacterium]
MPKALTYISAAALLAIAGAAYTADSPEPTREQVRATAMLEGKTAGEAQNCVQTRDLNGSLVADEGTILYPVNTRLVYRTQIEPACPFLTDDRQIVTRTNSTQICEGDQFEVVDVQYGTEYGLCNFGAFVPFRAAGD